MTEEDWHTPFAKTFGLLLDGTKLEWLTPEGELVADDTFLLLLNAHHEPLDFTLPAGDWEVTIATSDNPAEIQDGAYQIEARSLTVLELKSPEFRLRS